MSLSYRKVASIAILALLSLNSVMALTPLAEYSEPTALASSSRNHFEQSESLLDMDIAYVDNHYGSADGIIDPKEYASSYTDPTTGVTVYLEHNSTLVYVGLSSTTRG
ncbi:MAG: hypothetical protein ACW99U_03385, partial [Candidatus Thorarchaeota archaeon]